MIGTNVVVGTEAPIWCAVEFLQQTSVDSVLAGVRVNMKAETAPLPSRNRLARPAIR
jgi:hypothetical protein